MNTESDIKFDSVIFFYLISPGAMPYSSLKHLVKYAGDEKPEL